MKIVQINTVCGVGSTGRICIGVSDVLDKNNIENYIIYTHRKSDYKNAIKCSQKSIKFQGLLSRIKGNYGFNSKSLTKKMIRKLEQIKPDIVHLHNIHGHNCHLEMLFNYLNNTNIKIVWTFHDCWAYTGYCVHYAMAHCFKWKKECFDCKQVKTYSWICDRSRENFIRKRKTFGKANLTITTPSEWLKGEVKQSFFKDNNIFVINNGIDISKFKIYDSNFKKKKAIGDKSIILGVAIEWVPRKGLDVFLKLSKELDKNKYQIVLVGTNEDVDRDLPDNIISIHRTNNQEELAEIYSAADVFVNPTREEVFGLVNIEALACGTPVITFNTGGSPECIDDTCGVVVEQDDFETLKTEIVRICDTKPYSSDDCRKRALNFDQEEKYKEYLEVYEELFLEVY